MARYMKLIKTLLLILGILSILLIINLFTPTKNLPLEALQNIQELNKNNPEDTDFLKASWEDIQERYNGENRCWKKHPTRNWLFDGKKIWDLQNECLPCQIYNNLFQAYLLESGRFQESQIKTKITGCEEAFMIHMYSIVTLNNGTKINIDAWGSDFEVPFGQTIHNTGVCKK